MDAGSPEQVWTGTEVEALTRVERVRAIAVSEKGEKASNEILNMLLPAAFMLLLFASVVTGGQYLMTTTIEEKSSRVVEVLLSALSPMQLMTGKILGQMGVGFVILGVYAGMGMTALASFALLGLVDPWLLFYLVIFYVISYVVVASLMAAVGAAVNEMREAQSFMGPIMVVLTIPWILWMPISRDPNSAFAVVTSFLPPINSFVMLIRMASTTPPPLWQVWLSIAGGRYLAVWGALWFAAKIFRIGLLMFGKPPDLKDPHSLGSDGLTVLSSPLAKGGLGGFPDSRPRIGQIPPGPLFKVHLRFPGKAFT